MIEINDYSGRRGVLVAMLPKIHAIMKDNAGRDKFGLTKQPEHLVTWQQKTRQTITDIRRRLIVAQDGEMIAGILFYLCDGGKVFIEDVQVAWAYRNNPTVIDGFIRRLECDPGSKDAVFFASERIKTDANTEILASKGFKKTYENGMEELGTLSQACQALKIRYSRGV